MSDAVPAVIEVALNGITTRDRSPHVPVGPEALAEDALACLEAGAAIVHTHSAEFFAPPEALAEDYAECYRRVLAVRPDAILYPTIGGGAGAGERFGHFGPLAVEGLIRCSVLDPGSVNFGGAGPDGLPPEGSISYVNSAADIREGVETARTWGLGPSVAVWEPGFLQVVLALHEAGTLPAGTLVKLYFALGGYLPEGRPLWGVPPIPEGLAMYLAMLEGTGLPWAVAAVGGPLLDTGLVPTALERGGHLRVGLEDDPDGPANATQVAAAARMVEAAGRPVATPADAADLLGLAPTP